MAIHFSDREAALHATFQYLVRQQRMLPNPLWKVVAKGESDRERAPETESERSPVSERELLEALALLVEPRIAMGVFIVDPAKA